MNQYYRRIYSWPVRTDGDRCENIVGAVFRPASACHVGRSRLGTFLGRSWQPNSRCVPRCAVASWSSIVPDAMHLCISMGSAPKNRGRGIPSWQASQSKPRDHVVVGEHPRPLLATCSRCCCAGTEKARRQDSAKRVGSLPGGFLLCDPNCRGLRPRIFLTFEPSRVTSFRLSATKR